MTDVDGKDKQVIMEWWSHNVNFKGLDLRFEYDSSKLKPSNVSTNDYAYNSSIFEFETIFEDYMDYMIINDSEGSNVVRMNMALLPENISQNPNEYIKQLEDGTYYVDTTGDVLIGRMSFRLFNGDIDETTFRLKASSANKSPITGIKINHDGVDSYEEQSVFRFTLLSSNAYLKNIEKCIYKDESETLVYTDIESFDKEKLEYEIILNEYKDYISLIPSLEDEKSTIKIKVPKRDADGNLQYKDDVLEYEEKQLEDGKINVKLNELGKEDTIVEFIVLAEDGKTTNTYKVKIHRPFGTIKGNIQLGIDLRDAIQDSYGTYVEYIANITAYEPGAFDWDGIIPKTSFLDDLELIDYKSQTQSDKDDGYFELYVIPGQYDLILERLGFLANIIKEITISENEVIDLGNKILLEGDVDRSGIIDLDDIVTIVDVSDSSYGDGIYDIKYDFGQKGFVAIDDLVSTVTNSDNLITIEKY